MNARLFVAPALIVMALTSVSVAAPATRDAQSLLDEVVGRAGEHVAGGAMVAPAADGTIRYLGTARGRTLATPAGATMAERAHGFLFQHAEAFGLVPGADLALEKTQSGREQRTYHRFQETLGGVPVIGGETVVQRDAAGGVQAVMNRVGAPALLAGVSTTPSLDANAILSFARTAAAPHGEPIELGTPELGVFVPELFEGKGPARLVWQVPASGGEAHRHEQLVLDARDGTLVWRFSLDADALSRTIQDANGTADRPFTTVRTEGGAASGITDADLSYDYLGDTYNFYLTYHGRDSFDGSGAAFRGVVRYCGFPNAAGALISCSNAQFTSTDTMYVGAGFAADDIIAHEVTHGVTSRTSQLAYQNASGAINESMSDIWGEYVDLNNGRGTDPDSLRWRIGEDRTGGPLRDMKTPGRYGSQPDRFNSPLYVAPTGTPTVTNDFGGVHTNSGVGNKLCYLLTDGDTFNGWTITGLGGQVIYLYYEAQTHLLTSSSNWNDLYYALRQGVLNLGWDLNAQNTVYKACAAVEIATSTTIYANSGSACTEAGIQSCIAGFGPFHTIGNAQSQMWPGTSVVLAPATYHEGILLFNKAGTYTTSGGTAVVTP